MKLNTLPGQRMTVVDSLRGFALMGLFIVHMVEYFELYWYLPEPGWVHNLVFFLFGGKAYAIFALLFGLSFFIIMDNQARRGVDFRGRFAWRLTLLLGMGYIHGLLYSGDILQVLAVSGFFLIVVYNLPGRYLLLLGLAFLLQLPLLALIAWHLANASVPADPAFLSVMSINFEIYAQGSFVEVVHRNLFWGQWGKWLFGFESGRFWTILGMFTVGFALGRMRFFANYPDYLKHVAGVLIAVLLIAVLLGPGLSPWLAGLEPAWLRNAVQEVVNNYQNTCLTLAGIALFVLFFRWKWTRMVLSPLAAPGRMSLTFYVGQSIVGVPLFYGFGLGWYTGLGQVNALMLGIVLWLLQIALAKWWLARYRYGPLEWVWRAATLTRTDIPWKKRPIDQPS